MKKTIEIPEGYEARIEDNKVIIEPKKSKDEIIRKALVELVRKHCVNETRCMMEEWLEKQGEQNPKSTEFIPTDCTSDAKYENRWHKVEDSLPDNAREVLCKDAIGNFFIGRYYNDGDYWEVSIYDEPDKSNEYNPPVIMWMNIPSCEQNLANSAKTCKDEQKPVDKVEPKFKDGQWIVWQDKYYKVNYNGCGYELVDQNGSSIALEYGPIDENAHLWNIIQDAKNGDVLYTPKGCGVEGIFLIGGWKQVKDTGRTLCSDIGYRVEDDEIIAGGLGAIWWEGVVDPFYPATKEQRDILFQKMREAGYEWDTEKKELKKIEQEPAWSEEDERMWSTVLQDLQNIKDDSPIVNVEPEFNWLKSVKERYTWKPSDEQMDALYTYIYNPQYFNSPDPRFELVESVYKDLKKLKG